MTAKRNARTRKATWLAFGLIALAAVAGATLEQPGESEVQYNPSVLNTSILNTQYRRPRALLLMRRPPLSLRLLFRER